LHSGANPGRNLTGYWDGSVSGLVGVDFRFFCCVGMAGFIPLQVFRALKRAFKAVSLSARDPICRRLSVGKKGGGDEGVGRHQ